MPTLPIRAGALTLLLALQPALASDTPTPPPTLTQDPVRFETLGLAVHLPEGAIVETTSLGSTRQSVSVRDAANAWRIEFSERTTREGLTPKALASELLQDIRNTWSRFEQPETGGKPKALAAPVKLLDQTDNLTLSQRAASRFYVLTPSPNSDTRVVTGVTVVPTEPTRFSLLTLSCLEPEFERARIVYESVVASAAWRDPGEALAERAAAVLAGTKFLRSLSQDDYRAALPPEPQYYRIFRPSPTGAQRDDTELAYQMVDIREGSRGELNPRKPRQDWTPADRDPGFIVRVVARYVQGQAVSDLESVFFATLRRDATDEEAWTSRMKVREGAATTTWSQTGARIGNRLSVRTESSQGAPGEQSWIIPDDGYLTQVQSYFLPRLMARAGSPIVLGFYAYNPSTGDLSLRRDALEPALSADTGWVLKTRLSEGAAERSTTLSRTGDILRLETADGAMMEPIDPEALNRLWKSKGLPTSN